MAQQLALIEDDEVPPMPGKVEQQAYEIYNEVAGRVGWTKAQKLTPDRCKKLKRAVKDVGGLIEWRKALERGGRSTFLTTKFRPDLEFVTRLPKLTKMAEGGFDDQGTDTSTGKPLSRQMAPQDDWGRFLRDYKLRGFWPTSLGARPEDPACRAPAAMLAACRERLGIQVAPVVAESREDRLRASIAAYRRVGRYEDANRVERELSKLTGLPPVEVPAPEARDPDQMPKPLSKPIKGGVRSGGLKPFTDVPPAEAERDRRTRAIALSEPPPWTEVPESDQFEEEA